MHPVLLKTDAFTIYSYGVCMALAAAAAWFLVARLAKKSGYPPGQATDILFLLFVTGVVGARVFYVLQHPSEFEGRWQAAFLLQEGGLVWYGGFIGAVISGWVYAHFKKMSVFYWADLFCPVLPLAHAIGRVGCWLNGCCFGRWEQPVQLYEAALLLVLSAGLFRLFDKRKHHGEVFAAYLAGYGVLRFLLEFLRGDQQPLAVLTLPQWISAGCVLAGLWLYSRVRRG
jgi:phosphatidylglycerol---prolipoprotein diacylglyceryl transferase